MIVLFVHILTMEAGSFSYTCILTTAEDSIDFLHILAILEDSLDFPHILMIVTSVFRNFDRNWLLFICILLYYLCL
jgi:hypothetical protein